MTCSLCLLKEHEINPRPCILNGFELCVLGIVRTMFFNVVFLSKHVIPRKASRLPIA